MLGSKPISVGLCAALVFCAGCEQRFRKAEDADAIPRTIGTFADPKCQNQAGIDSLGPQTVARWRDGSLHMESFDFSAASSRDVLKAAGVDSAIHGISMGFVQKCIESANGTFACQSAGGEIRPTGRGIIICKQDADFPAGTIEGVALSTLASVMEAQSFLTSLQAIKPSLTMPRTLNLSILPYVEDKYLVRRANGEEKTISEQRSDNAFWMATQQGASYITVLPTSSNFRIAAPSSPNLWQVPFVVAHEFGHNFFYANAENAMAFANKIPHSAAYTPRLPLAEHLGPITPTRGKPSAGADSSSSGGRLVDHDEVLTVANEAFADLFSFLTLGAQPGLTIDVACMADRDVAQPYLVSGHSPRPKILDSHALNEFFSIQTDRGVPQDNPVCPAYTLQDPHILGAVLAHAIHILVQHQTLPSQGLILADWAQRIESAALRKNIITPRNLLDEVVVAALSAAAAAEDGNLLNSTQCIRAKALFPEHATSALATKLGCLW